MALKWKDKKDVAVLSTIHDNAFDNVVSKKGIARDKPKAVIDYNANMGGVDLSDSMLCHYSTARNRMKKFYLKIFRHLLDITVLNSFVIYHKMGGKMSRLNFIILLGETLISKNQPSVQSTSIGRPSCMVEKTSRLIGRHFPDYCPATEKNPKPTRKCAQCRKNNIRKQSSYWCPDCEVGLCVSPCFKIWHTVN